LLSGRFIRQDIKTNHNDIITVSEILSQTSTTSRKVISHCMLQQLNCQRLPSLLIARSNVYRPFQTLKLAHINLSVVSTAQHLPSIRSITAVAMTSGSKIALPQPRLEEASALDTTIVPVLADEIGHIRIPAGASLFPDDWTLDLKDTASASNLQLAAQQLRESDVPVAFPTETVYGLGADATRSAAVRGIFAAKRRPADNPLIVHFASVRQLRDLLSSSSSTTTPLPLPQHQQQEEEEDPIPAIYKPLIAKFWPGPLTIILPLPMPSPLAPEVTAGLATFGARIPAHLIALNLIRLADRPVAAPSANASTRPSPTTAQHVAHDLGGRIALIVDGGACDVGVESTVVDGLSRPPVVLRPGGVSIAELRQCEGWSGVEVAYQDRGFEDGESAAAPRAPGMKYKHYSPRARVVLLEDGAELESGELRELLGPERVYGVIQTRRWGGEGEGCGDGDGDGRQNGSHSVKGINGSNGVPRESLTVPEMLNAPAATKTELGEAVQHVFEGDNQLSQAVAWTIRLGANVKDVARGLFSALRDLDAKGVEVIFVEGLSDRQGDLAAAVMNRLRKAAGTIVSGSNKISDSGDRTLIDVDSSIS
jgi:L-threonylcarbamoyladenylate synthase